MKSYVALFICLLSRDIAARSNPCPRHRLRRPARSGRSSTARTSGPPVDPEQGGQPINIRLDVSVIDQTAQGAAQPKSLMVMLVDRAMGRTRAAFQDRSIAVDARPTSWTVVFA